MPMNTHLHVRQYEFREREGERDRETYRQIDRPTDRQTWRDRDT